MGKKYTNKVKLAFALGAENEMLTKNMIKKVPHATRNYFRKQNPEKYLTSAQKSDLGNVNFSYGIDFKYLRLLSTFQNLAHTLIKDLGPKQYYNLLEQNKKEVVSCIEENKSRFSKAKLLSSIGVSSARYSIWKSQVDFSCKSSLQSLCAKRHSQQLTTTEIKELERLLNQSRFANWPLSAVWAWALRKEKLLISRSSFYRYNKIFNFRKPHSKRERPDYTPLRAEGINKIWHADLTYVYMLNGKWAFVYAVIDNFSKKVLAYRVEPRIKAVHARQCFEDALVDQKIEKLTYITDGGKEYDNSNIREFLRAYDLKVVHKIAKRDIKQSNSMIERLFHLVKKDYLYKRAIHNIEELRELMDEVFNEYNNRPHYVHEYFTPNEIHAQRTTFNPAILLAQGNELRMHTNQSCNCTVCVC